MSAEKQCSSPLDAPTAFVDYRPFSAWVRPAAILAVALGIVAALGLGLNAAHEVDP